MNENVYQLELAPEAVQDLKQLNKKEADRILKKMAWVAQNATLIVHEALKGEWAGFYRYRLGTYRVIYRLAEMRLVLLIVAIGHRKEIYEN